MGDKPVAAKLRLTAGATCWSSHPDRLGLLGPLPAGVRTVNDPGTADVALVFADDAASLRAVLDANRDSLGAPSVLWVLYPKANRIDLNRDSLWPILADYGVRPIAQVAVDDTWSALRFRPRRPGEPPFGGGRQAVG